MRLRGNEKISRSRVFQDALEGNFSVYMRVLCMFFEKIS